MSEVMTNQAAMYDSVEAIRNLNSVEGFNPRDFMRVIQGEGESAKYYLDVAFRKLHKFTSELGIIRTELMGKRIGNKVLLCIPVI